MQYKKGLFLPDNFPCPYDSTISVLHKVAVINGVSGSVLLRTCPMKKTHVSSATGRRFHMSKVLDEIYGLNSLSSLNEGSWIISHFPVSSQGVAKYCPRCLAEAGFVPSFFSLQFMVRCPWHNQALRPMCKKCLNIHKFVPRPFGSWIGYMCPDCEYWVPRRAAIFEICRNRAADPLHRASSAFFLNLDSLARLSVLDVLHYRPSAAADTNALNIYDAREFLPDTTVRQWYKRLEVTAPNLSPPASDMYYRRFIHFHQRRLLKAHHDCVCCRSLSRPDLGEQQYNTCIYAAALSLFRQKFEYLSNDQHPHLSGPAALALRALAMTPSTAHHFFQIMFYQLVSRLWFWSRSASRFVVHIDPEHFFQILDDGSALGMLDRLLGKRLEGCYHYLLDLPVDRTSLRRLMGAVKQDQGFIIRNFGNRAEFTTTAQSHLFFGSLKATAMFYL
ncbi:hypothetical protein C4K09_3004 [Pseudomonas chlororaphis subsp. aureofaciens]|nr:hypothetical protein C4K09_3004 [Pseudomonas chlororaphis subsp. aureofaciens]